MAPSLCAWLCIVIVEGGSTSDHLLFGYFETRGPGSPSVENKHGAGRSGVHQKPWRPAFPRMIRRKCQLRIRRNLGMETRCLARFQRRIHAAYGTAAAWLCRPAVYLWVCRTLFVGRFMRWCRLVVFVVTTSHHRKLLCAALFYVCCVFGLPLMPDTINVLQAGVFISLEYFRIHKTHEPRASKPVGAAYQTRKKGAPSMCCARTWPEPPPSTNAVSWRNGGGLSCNSQGDANVANGAGGGNKRDSHVPTSG